MPRDIYMILSLILTVGACEPVPPEEQASPEATANIADDTTTPERLTIIGYRLAPGTDEEEVERLLSQGISEDELARRGLITNLRSIVPQRKWSGELKDAWALDDQTIADGRTLTFSLFSTERANVYHNPPANTCRAVFVRAWAWWLSYGWPPMVRSEWSWSLDGSDWVQWGRLELLQVEVPVLVWAGSERSRFRYHFVNHAFTFSVPGVSEPGERNVSVRAVSQNASACGHGSGGGGSW